MRGELHLHDKRQACSAFNKNLLKCSHHNAWPFPFYRFKAPNEGQRVAGGCKAKGFTAIRAFMVFHSTMSNQQQTPAALGKKIHQVIARYTCSSNNAQAEELVKICLIAVEAGSELAKLSNYWASQGIRLWVACCEVKCTIDIPDLGRIWNYQPHSMCWVNYLGSRFSERKSSHNFRPCLQTPPALSLEAQAAPHISLHTAFAKSEGAPGAVLECSANV